MVNLNQFYRCKKTLNDLIRKKAPCFYIKRTQKFYDKIKRSLEQEGIKLSIKNEIDYLEFCVNRDTLLSIEKRCRKCEHFFMRDTPEKYGCSLYGEYSKRVLCNDFKKSSMNLKERIIEFAFKRCFLCKNMHGQECLEKLNRINPDCSSYEFRK